MALPSEIFFLYILQIYGDEVWPVKYMGSWKLEPLPGLQLTICFCLFRLWLVVLCVAGLLPGPLWSSASFLDHFGLLYFPWNFRWSQHMHFISHAFDFLHFFCLCSTKNNYYSDRDNLYTRLYQVFNIHLYFWLTLKRPLVISHVVLESAKVLWNSEQCKAQNFWKLKLNTPVQT